jgi:N-acetylmuramoyl-L-alanine amidase
MVVLHYTAMDSATAALDRLSAPETEVSAHYLISEGGEVFSLVPEEMRAWHAGAGQWGAVTDVNSRSIGIEIANTGFAPFPEPQMLALERLLHDIMRRWAIQPERIIGHSDMAPGRKIDPGLRFDWRRLALGGLSVWPDPISKPPDKTGLVDMLHAFGMTAESDAEILLKAFRLRFRPWASGAQDDLDLAMASDLAMRYPVDQLPLTS